MDASAFSAIVTTAERLLAHISVQEHDYPFAVSDLHVAARHSVLKWRQDTARVAPLFSDCNTGHDYARLFAGWRKNPPVMVAIVAAATQELGVYSAEPVFLAAVLAAFAAEMPLSNAYHDNHHFREVAAMMAVYCGANQRLARDGHEIAAVLSSADIAKCLLAAVAHDLQHDGCGNTVNGVHQPFRLEHRAVAVLEPLMELAGMTAADRAEVATLIYATDVSAAKGARSPHQILRALLSGSNISVPGELSLLSGNPRLQYMAALMSDADLAPSSALNYVNSRGQSKRMALEDPAQAATDANLLGFLSHIVEKEFLSPAARYHSQSSLNQLIDKTASRVARAQHAAPRRTRRA